MKTINVNSEHAYDVCIGSEWRSEFIAVTRTRIRVAVVVSEFMRDKVGDLPSVDSDLHIFAIPDGEKGKNEQTLFSLWNWLGAAGFTRSDLLIGIGGGATTDIAGFAAATWLRGIDWVAIPTTLAGMVDAAIGGKTGMNSGYGKNLIGAFHSPSKVIIDTDWLLTLTDRDFVAGLAEVIKCGFIADPVILDLVKDKDVTDIRTDMHLVEELIYRAVNIKASVVGVDFKDSFAREILNYGHTLGHAVEMHSGYKLRHGEAVAIGMVYIAELACQQGVLSRLLADLHRETLAAIGLPISYDLQAWDALHRTMALDKKARGKSVRFVAISEIAQTLRLEDLSESDLRSAYEKIST